MPAGGKQNAGLKIASIMCTVQSRPRPQSSEQQMKARELGIQDRGPGSKMCRNKYM